MTGRYPDQKKGNSMNRWKDQHSRHCTADDIYTNEVHTQDEAELAKLFCAAEPSQFGTGYILQNYTQNVPEICGQDH